MAYLAPNLHRLEKPGVVSLRREGVAFTGNTQLTLVIIESMTVLRIRLGDVAAASDVAVRSSGLPWRTRHIWNYGRLSSAAYRNAKPSKNTAGPSAAMTRLFGKPTSYWLLVLHAK